MHKKRNQRSVAIQSTGFFAPDSQTGHQPASLRKKTGFRNLLQKSVAIVSEENNEENENFPLPEGLRSKSVQVELESEFTNQKYRTGGAQSLEFSFLRKHPLERNGGSRTTTSEVVRVIDQALESSNPGTSRMTSGGFSSVSVLSQANNINLRKPEGSIAVIYSYGEKNMGNSMSSNLPFVYGSRGSRRFSDETVLLIEDYLSYDRTNAARRQDSESSGWSTFACCSKRTRRSSQVLTKPLPINLETFKESEETVCRICHEGEEIEPLIQPCLCKGSIGSVHANCLKVWLEQSSTSRCELCNYPYAIRQTKKYHKCVSIRVFYKTVIDRRALAYDVVSFVVITPLTLVGVVMCIQASILSGSGSAAADSTVQMGYITRVGMVMLSGTIIVAYSVWLYTLISYHYKSWKKWYNNCYDVEVIPVRMTSEERIEAARRLNEELSRRRLSREHGSAIVSILHSPPSHSFYHRRVSVATVMPVHQNERRILKHLWGYKIF